MTTIYRLILAMIFTIITLPVLAQDETEEIQTLFSGHSGLTHGGYGAISNKFTYINGDYANMTELYGGWFINRKLMLGVGAAAVTNHLPVAPEHSTVPGVKMSYEYGQVGMMTEYVLASNRAVHLSFSLLTGAGFTVQYIRDKWEQDIYEDFDYDHDQQWFFVAEPGVKVEFNVFRWMRFCPGVSYRITQGADGVGLGDDDLRGASLNLTMKFGRF